MALSSNWNALKVQRLEKILQQKAAAKSARMAKLWQFFQGHPKPAFSKKLQRGEEGKLFKNRPKSSPRLKGLKALWRKWHYRLIGMHLKCRDWKRFCSKKQLQRVPEWPSYGNFPRSPKTRIFKKSAKGGPREIFQKSPKK